MGRALIATTGTTLLLALAACGSDSASTPTGTKGQGLAGRWTGTLHQHGLAPFTVTATIESPAGSSGNSVHYSGIDCSSRWTYLSARGSGYRFREVIDRGRGGKCKGAGVVTLTETGRSPARLRYEFHGGGVVSRGTLRRVR